MIITPNMPPIFLILWLLTSDTHALVSVTYSFSVSFLLLSSHTTDCKYMRYCLFTYPYMYFHSQQSVSSPRTGAISILVITQFPRSVKCLGRGL